MGGRRLERKIIDLLYFCFSFNRSVVFVVSSEEGRIGLEVWPRRSGSKVRCLIQRVKLDAKLSSLLRIAKKMKKKKRK